MTLRRRLLFGLLLLTALGLGAAGFATTRLLHQSLLNQLDEQLQIRREFDRDGDGRGPRNPNGIELPGRPGGPLGAQSFLIGQYDPAGVFVSGVVDSGFDTSDQLDLDVTTARVDKPFTVFTSQSNKAYRVMVRPNSRGYSVTALELSVVDETVNRLVRVELGVALGVLTAMGLLAWIFVRRALRPLDRMTSTAVAIAAGDLSARVVDSDDVTEVGRLGSSMNTMLERIEAAFAEQAASEARLRRFVADASHELRTPLTSIRGYAELMRAGVISASDERHAALGRVEAEAQRMGMLVEDMLVLARADQGRPLTQERVDITALVHGAVSDARVSDPDRAWTMELSGEPIVLGDPMRLQQVVANLLSNARQHTSAGLPVDITVRTLDDIAEISIRDHGLGIDAAEAAAVFERFTRLDAGRARADGGSGLGLSIVQSLVEQHGGSVGVRSPIGGGAEFWINLPCISEPAVA